MNATPDARGDKSVEDETATDTTDRAKSQPKGIVTNATWNIGFTIWTMVISFVLAPIFIAYLGITDYGILLLVWSVTGIMGTLNLGLGEGTLRYVAYHHGERNIEAVNRVFGATLSLFSVICVIASLLLFIVAPLVAQWMNIPTEKNELVSWLLRLSAIAISLSITQGLFGAIILALQRYDINVKINLFGSVARASGYITLAISGYGILYIVVWDLFVSAVVFCSVVRATHRLLPKLNLLPGTSFAGLREIAGYSVFSFLTFFFHKLHRESGKLLLARFTGPETVAYLATPDNIAQRFHDVIASGVEATLPRFSGDRNASSAEVLFWNATWAGLSFSLILFVPFYVLVPDFLTLWISPEFATKSGLIGQLLALYLISQGAFTAPAAYFRGVGKPWFVTLIIFCSLLITTLCAFALIPAYGAIGAAYAYLVGSAAPFLGTVFGSIYAFGWTSLPRILRMIMLPVALGSIAGAVGLYFRGAFGELSWISLIANGFVLLIVSTVLVLGGDWLLGSERSPSRQLFRRLAKSRTVGFLFGRIA